MSILRLRGVVAACVCALAVAVQPVSAVLIDDFEEGPFSITAFTNVTSNQPGLSPSRVLNGYRGSTFEAGTDAGATVSLSVADNFDDSAKLNVPANQNGAWIAGYLRSFSPNAVPVVGNADLIADGHDSLAVTISEAPRSGVELLLFMFTDPIPGQRASVRRTVTGPGTYLLPFSDLVPFNGEGVPNLHDIDGLRVNVIATAGLDPITVGISEIRTAVVPEAATTGTLLLVVIGAARRRR